MGYEMPSECHSMEVGVRLCHLGRDATSSSFTIRIRILYKLTDDALGIRKDEAGVKQFTCLLCLVFQPWLKRKWFKQVSIPN